MDDLYHHGVKGQHWGIRRWQNPDGSYTAAGRAHYGMGQKKTGNAFVDEFAQRGMDFSAKQEKWFRDHEKLSEELVQEERRLVSDLHNHPQVIKARNAIDAARGPYKEAMKKWDREVDEAAMHVKSDAEFEKVMQYYLYGDGSTEKRKALDKFNRVIQYQTDNIIGVYKDVPVSFFVYHGRKREPYVRTIEERIREALLRPDSGNRTLW